MLEVAHFLFPGRASRRHALSGSNALMRAAGWDFLTRPRRSPEGTVFSPIFQLFCFTLFRTRSRNASTDMTTLCAHSPFTGSRGKGRRSVSAADTHILHFRTHCRYY